MSWSLSEARALAIKAARGSGMAWGVAEEAGFAVVWLQARGAPGVEALAELLDARDGKLTNVETCPLHLGASIMDGARKAPETEFVVEQPLVLLPFLANASGSPAMSLRFGDVEIAFSQLGISSAAPYSELLIADAKCVLTGGIMPKDVTCQTRVPVSAARSIQSLTTHAHKTYAPATEQSRLAGAGAGTTDND